MSRPFLKEQSDAIHRMWLIRLLTHIADDTLLAQTLAFKGGTCDLLGYLDRFSVNLDFDLARADVPLETLRTNLEAMFRELGLTVRDASARVPQYFLKYPMLDGARRNTIKVDVHSAPSRANRYEPKLVADINRVLVCETRDTIVANKLVALTDRHGKRGAIAGRDVYDIHYFLMHGFAYSTDVIEERTGKPAREYIASLRKFIAQHVSDTHLSQDLNALLPYETFTRIRKTLKQETLALLDAELRKLA